MAVDVAVEIKNTFLQTYASPILEDGDCDEIVIHRQQSDSVLDCKFWRCGYDNTVNLVTDDPVLIATCDDHTDFKDGRNDTINAVAVESTSELPDQRASMYGCTTVMLRNVPLCYSQTLLLTEINRAGFGGSFDYFYIPIDSKKQQHRGFAFINEGQRFIVIAANRS